MPIDERARRWSTHGGPSPRHGPQVLILAVVALTALWFQKASAQSGASEETHDLLASSARYITDLYEQASNIVRNEDYVQHARATMGVTRHLRSDLVVLASAAQGPIEFRDVFEVDGRVVRDSDDRIPKLLATGRPDAPTVARRVADESARFNLNPTGLVLNRSFNVPFAALTFLQGNNQARSRFRLAGSDLVGTERSAIVQFTEISKPRLIGTMSGAPANGRFWIVPSDGSVRAAELTFRDGKGIVDVTATVRIVFGTRTGSVWLPSVMDERYDVRAPGVSDEIEGHASYSSPRHFDVSVRERPNPNQ